MPVVWITVITLIFPRQSIATHLQNGLQGLKRARSSVRIERWSPEPKVRGSNPLGRIEELNGYKNTRRLGSRLVLLLGRLGRGRSYARPTVRTNAWQFVSQPACNLH